MNVPDYPTFAPLELCHKSLFDEAFTNNPPEISEFTFTNLYAWRQAYKISVSLLGSLIIIRSEKDSIPAFFVPIGKGNIKEAIAQILMQTRGVFIRISESTAGLFKGEGGIKTEPDRDNSDYLYKIADLSNLPGKKFDGKRNLIKKFRSQNKYEYISLNSSNVEECLKFEEAWCSLKNCDRVEGLDNERRAINEMIANFSAFSLMGAAIKVENKICAVAISQKLNPDTLVMHVLKADPIMPGLYQAMLNEFLRNQGNKFEYVNLEQDLGIEGLRKSKLSYHPVKMINKFKLSLMP